MHAVRVEQGGHAGGRLALHCIFCHVAIHQDLRLGEVQGKARLEQVSWFLQEHAKLRRTQEYLA